jgi:hypothetical protein
VVQNPLVKTPFVVCCGIVERCVSFCKDPNRIVRTHAIELFHYILCENRLTQPKPELLLPREIFLSICSTSGDYNNMIEQNGTYSFFSIISDFWLACRIIAQLLHQLLSTKNKTDTFSALELVGNISFEGLEGKEFVQGIFIDLCNITHQILNAAAGCVDSLPSLNTKLHLFSELLQQVLL